MVELRRNLLQNLDSLLPNITLRRDAARGMQRIWTVKFQTAIGDQKIAIKYIMRLSINFLIFFSIAINCYADTKYTSPKLPEPTLEDMRKIFEKNSLEKPNEKSLAIVNNYWVSGSIANDLIQQHYSCFLLSEAQKQNKSVLLDYELSESQKKAASIVFTPRYREELIQNNLFELIKHSIAKSLTNRNEASLDMAYKLLNEEIGVDFALAWITPILVGTIDKSCGSIPYEATAEDWRQQMLWGIQSKVHKLN